jgi:hypothetical protein
VQPFSRRGARYDADFLWRIGQLDNADKHRKLVSAASAVHMESALPLGVPDPKEVHVQRTWALGGAIAAGVSNAATKSGRVAPVLLRCS